MMRSYYSANTNQSWLSWFLRGVLFLFFLVLFGKLFEVQIIKGGYYRNLSEQNRIRRIPIPAARGRIVSADGKSLADNTAIKEHVLMSEGGVTLSNDLTNALPEDIVTNYKRVYPLGEKFAHASGYLGVVSEKEVGTVDPRCPEKGVIESGDLIGVTGLEQEYDCELRGTPGEELIEVNTAGKRMRILGIKNPLPGQDINTSIDSDLQIELADSMDKKGAAIITGADGRVLAFYSEPSFDPNLLIDRSDTQKISDLLKNPDLPFFDRVIAGTFHPGSVFKPVTALAALEESAIDKNFTFNDPGVITVNGFSYANWYFTENGRLEGQINLTRAIARSTDTFFYKIGEMVGPINIAKWSDIFGLDKPTDVDLPGEKEGLIPTPDWKVKTKNEPWFLGNTYNMSIGQGDVAVTPIEINTYIAAIASDGKICQPSFVSKGSPVCRQVPVNKNNIDLVKKGMLEACASGGTGYTFFDFTQKHSGLSVACKTGTAEVGTDGIPHAWFTLFVPAQNPQIVATFLVERGGQGSSVAGPIARKLTDYYFDRIKTNAQQSPTP